MKRVETITQEAPPALPVSAVARDVGATTAVTVGLPSAKVKDGHRQRKAIVYIRQSTPQQVLEHREVKVTLAPTLKKEIWSRG